MNMSSPSGVFPLVESILLLRGHGPENGLLRLFYFCFHPLLVDFLLALPLNSKLAFTALDSYQQPKIPTMTPLIIIGPPFH